MKKQILALTFAFSALSISAADAQVYGGPHRRYNGHGHGGSIHKIVDVVTGRHQGGFNGGHHGGRHAAMHQAQRQHVRQMQQVRTQQAFRNGMQVGIQTVAQQNAMRNQMYGGVGYNNTLNRGLLYQNQVNQIQMRNQAQLQNQIYGQNAAFGYPAIGGTQSFQRRGGHYNSGGGMGRTQTGAGVISVQQVAPYNGFMY